MSKIILLLLTMLPFTKIRTQSVYVVTTETNWLGGKAVYGDDLYISEILDDLISKVDINDSNPLPINSIRVVTVCTTNCTNDVKK